MRLDEAIVACCDAAEVAALAAELGLDRPAAQGEQIPQVRAAALLEATGRAGRAADLTEALAAAHSAVDWAALPWPPAALAPLHADLCRRHTLDSLRTLCFRLGLDYDELPGETKSGRARELVLAMNRAGRVMELWGDTNYERRDTSGDSDELRAPSDKVRGRRAALKRARSALPGRNTSLFARLSYFVSRMSLLVFVLAAGWAALLALAKMNAHEAAASLVRPASSTATRLPSPAATPTVPLFTARSALPTEPLPTDAPATASIVIVGSRGANLRRGPSAGFPVVATLRAGARLELLAVSLTGEWYQVRYPGHGSPWIDAGYAEINGDTGGLPVATAAAPPATAGEATATPGSRPANSPPASPTPRPTVAPTATAAPTRTAPPPLPWPTLPPP